MKLRKNLLVTEIIITIIQLLIIVSALSVQVLYGSCCHINYIPSIDENTTGIFIQVDATILTLTISLVAIMSALLSDSYMGVSYSNYFLNVRPRIYKQICIILLSLLYFFVSAISFWLEWNYIVFALLICEILLIVMSSISVYSIFFGKTIIKREIADYLYKKQIGK